MSIILRTNKGSALTYDEMDRNQSQFYYSSSLSPDNTKIRLHFTGSDNLDLPGEDYGPNSRYDEILLPSTNITAPTATVAGNNTQIQFNDGGNFGANSNFVFNKVGNLLGLGTSDPKFKLDIQGSGISEAIIALRGYTAGTTDQKQAKINFYGGSTFLGRIGRTVGANTDLYVTSTARVNIGISTEEEDDDSTIVGSFTRSNNIPRLGIGTKTPNRVGTFVGSEGIGISLSSPNTDQSLITPIPEGIFSPTNLGGLKKLIPHDSDESGLLISSPNSANGGNIVVALNTDLEQKEGFNIIKSSQGNYTNSSVIASFQASGKVGINTNFPSDVGLTVAGIVSGSGNANFQGNISGGGTLGITGNSTLGGTLDVTGDTSVSTFDSTGATSLATTSGAVNIASTEAITTVKGTLNVKQPATLDSTLSVASFINATGDITGNRIIKQGGTNQQILLANGDTTTLGGVTVGDVITNSEYSANGSRIYQKLSTGLIIQAGIINRTGNTGQVSNLLVPFPLAFPNAVLGVNVTTGRTGEGASGYDYVHTVTNTNFRAAMDSQSSGQNSYFIAIGY